jgi:hypothetical protein
VLTVPLRNPTKKGDTTRTLGEHGLHVGAGQEAVGIEGAVSDA